MTVTDYINGLNGEAKVWLTEFIDFMTNQYPELQPKISYGMPMYVLGRKMNDKGYIAFSAAKEHFTLHVHPDKTEFLFNLKDSLPKAKFGKGCIKINFLNPEYKPLLKETINNLMLEQSTK